MNRIISVMLLCLACGGASAAKFAAEPSASSANYAEESSGDSGGERAPTPVPGVPGPDTPPAPPPLEQQRQPPPRDPDQPLSPARKPLLIYIATMTLAVFEARKNIDAVEKLAIERGGYLVRRTDGAITVRVPADRFGETLEQVATLGDVIGQEVTAQDVTAEFRDLEIRLRNLEAVRDRLARLLDQAKTVQDAIAVEQQLERVTGQIEEIKGRLKLFSELIAYSTINVVFQARPVETLSSQVKLPFGWLEELGLSRLLSL